MIVANYSDRKPNQSPLMRTFYFVFIK